MDYNSFTPTDRSDSLEPSKLNYPDHQLKDDLDNALPPINSFMRPASASSTSSAYSTGVHAPPYQNQYQQLNYMSYNNTYSSSQALGGHGQESHQLYDLDKNYNTNVMPSSQNYGHTAVDSSAYMNPSLKYMGHSAYNPQFSSYNPLSGSEEYQYNAGHYNPYQNPYPPMPMNAAQTLPTYAAPIAPPIPQTPDVPKEPQGVDPMAYHKAAPPPAATEGGKKAAEPKLAKDGTKKSSASSSARYQCDLCEGKEFVTLPVISKHIRQHNLVLCNLCVKTFPTVDDMKAHECRPRGSSANYPKCPICLKYLSNTWSLSRHMKTHKRDSMGVKVDGSKSGSDDGSKDGSCSKTVFGEDDSKEFDKSNDTIGDEGTGSDDHQEGQHSEFVLKNPRVVLEKLSLTQYQTELNLDQSSSREEDKNKVYENAGEEEKRLDMEVEKNGEGNSDISGGSIPVNEKCVVCGKEFKNRTYLYKHLKSVHTAKIMKPSSVPGAMGGGIDNPEDPDKPENGPVKPDTAKALAKKFSKKVNGKPDYSPTSASSHMDNNNNSSSSSNGSGTDYLVPLSSSNANQININTSGNSITIISNVTYCNTQHDVPINSAGPGLMSANDGRMVDPKYDQPPPPLPFGGIDPGQKAMEMIKYDNVGENSPQKMIEPTPFVIQKLKKEVIVHSMDGGGDRVLDKCGGDPGKDFMDPILETYSIKKEEPEDPELIQREQQYDTKKMCDFPGLGPVKSEHSFESQAPCIPAENINPDFSIQPQQSQQQLMPDPATLKKHDSLLDFDDTDLMDQDSILKSDELERSDSVEEKAHPCDECGKCFAKRSQLTRHKNIHKNIIYICPFCQREPFKARNSLKNHLKTNHKDMKDKWGDPAYISAQVIKDPEKVDEYMKNWNERTKPNLNGGTKMSPGKNPSVQEYPGECKMNLPNSTPQTSSYDKPQVTSCQTVAMGNLQPAPSVAPPPPPSSSSKKKKKSVAKAEPVNVPDSYTGQNQSNLGMPDYGGVKSGGMPVKQEPFGHSTQPVSGFYQYGPNGGSQSGYNPYQQVPSSSTAPIPGASSSSSYPVPNHPEYGYHSSSQQSQIPPHLSGSGNVAGGGGVTAGGSTNLGFQSHQTSSYPNVSNSYVTPQNNGPYVQPQSISSQQQHHQHTQQHHHNYTGVPTNPNYITSPQRTGAANLHPMSPPISPHLQQQQQQQPVAKDYCTPPVNTGDQISSNRAASNRTPNYSAPQYQQHQARYPPQPVTHQYYTQNINTNHHSSDNASYSYTGQQASYPPQSHQLPFSGGNPPYGGVATTQTQHTIPPTPPPSATSFSSASSTTSSTSMASSSLPVKPSPIGAPPPPLAPHHQTYGQHYENVPPSKRPRYYPPPGQPLPANAYPPADPNLSHQYHQYHHGMMGGYGGGVGGPPTQ